MNENTGSRGTQATDIRTLVDATEARRLLGVGAFTVHNKWPSFVDKFMGNGTRFKFFDFSSLSPEKKRERIMLVAAVVGALAFGGYYLASGVKKEVVATDFGSLLNDPNFAAVLKRVQDEKQTVDVGPEVLQESLRRFKKENP